MSCTICAICAKCAILLGKVLSKKGFLSKEILRCGRGGGGVTSTPYGIRVHGAILFCRGKEVVQYGLGVIQSVSCVAHVRYCRVS